MGNKNLKKSGIYINELVNLIFWVNENQILKKFENITLFNGCFNPCPNLENYVSAISNQFQNKNKFLQFQKISCSTMCGLGPTIDISPFNTFIN